MKDGKLVYHYNYFDRQRLNIVSKKPVPRGKVELELAFAYEGGGLGKGAEAILYMNGEEMGRGKLKATVAGRFGIDTFDIGCDTGSPVSLDYKPPFAYTGKIERVDIKLAPRDLSKAQEEELHERYLAFAQHIE